MFEFIVGFMIGGFMGGLLHGLLCMASDIEIRNTRKADADEHGADYE